MDQRPAQYQRFILFQQFCVAFDYAAKASSWRCKPRPWEKAALPSNLWRISCFLPNRLERIDFDPILCTWARTDQLRTDCRFDFGAVKTVMTATRDRRLFVQIRGSLERLCGGEEIANEIRQSKDEPMFALGILTLKFPTCCYQNHRYSMGWYHCRSWKLSD